MNLNNKTSDTQIYIRNKYSNGLPYTSEDIHQETDLLKRKMGILVNSMIGSGLLETPTFIISEDSTTKSIGIKEPFPVNINGEVFLAGNSKDTYPIQVPKNYTGSIILLCWVTNISSSSTLYEYGGLNNKTLENNIIDDNLNIQTSSKYQIRWCICYTNVVYDYYNPSIISSVKLFNVKSESGLLSSVTLSSSNASILGHVYRYNSTSNIPSADNFIYMIPIGSIYNGIIASYKNTVNLVGATSVDEPSSDSINVWYNPTNDQVKLYFNGNWVNISSQEIIKQSTEPVTTKEGTFWYNPDTQEFKIYIPDTGFVGVTAKMGFIQLQNSHIFTSNVSTPSNIDVDIPIDTYLSTDILKVTYEGIELYEDLNYTLDSTNKKITLLDFTVNSGDRITFTATRLVSSSELSSTIELLNSHMTTNSTSTIFGHCRVTDEVSSNYDASTNTAATPAAVKSVENKINTLNDDTTNYNYKLGINNGLIYIRKVE